VIGFLRHRGQMIPSPAVYDQITAAFKEALRAWCRARDIPWLRFKMVLTHASSPGPFCSERSGFA
jgi:hypothetical protein